MYPVSSKTPSKLLFCEIISLPPSIDTLFNHDNVKKYPLAVLYTLLGGRLSSGTLLKHFLQPISVVK